MWWIIGTAVVAIAFYVWVTAMSAKMATERAPKVDMFSCDKHGAIPAKYAIPFDGMGVLEKPVLTCPFCFEDRGREAQKNLVGRGQ